MMSLTICRMEIMGCTQIDFFQLKISHYEVQKHITQSLNSANRQTDKTYLPSQLKKHISLKPSLQSKRLLSAKQQLSSAADQTLTKIFSFSNYLFCVYNKAQILLPVVLTIPNREKGQESPYFLRQMGDGHEQVQQHKTHTVVHTHKHTKCP